MELHRPDRGGSPPSWSPAFATRVLRNPRLYWLAAIALLAVTVITVSRLTASAERSRAAYGETVEVAVASDRLAAGDTLAGRFDVRAMPLAVVPEDALREVADDATATSAVSGGAILTMQDVSRAQALPTTRAAVAVPVVATTPPLSVGQQVLLVLHGDAFSGIDGGLIEAVVHTETEEQIVLAVDRTDLLALATALVGNGMTIALT